MPRLFNRKTIDARVAVADAPDPAGRAALKEWAGMIASGRTGQLGETELHGQFMQKICIEALGYKGPVGHEDYTVTAEKAILQGSVDLAFGRFTDNDRVIIAPFELKGAKTKDLDAILPGRAKTTIDQAWEYATNNPGTQWVLASNYLEIRLYSYVEGRTFHETFDLSKLHKDNEYKRFFLILGAENLLGGRTAALLEQSKREDKDISEQLYADYKTLRQNLIGAVGEAAPGMGELEAIGIAQTILDRILFIAFAEDNGLIPDGTIAKAYEDQSTFNPKPIWESFLGLFRAIDQGSQKASILRYNGGLFSRDAVIRELEIPDHICEGFKELAGYDFASEVPVTVLGRIFEQSISDIETLQKRALGEEVEEKKGKGASGRKKRDGVVYTPDYIARFIVEQTIGAHLSEIFAGILSQYADKGAEADDDPIKWKSRKAEREAWSLYRERIAKLRIVDPACGSGVFLVMAFDFLKAELVRVNDKLAELEGKGQAGGLFDPDSEILTNNLFGVDVNEESVEIAKLSLWIKTARRGKVLDSLDANFRVGDSLIEDSSYAYREHGFVWKDAFPEIFVEGGFDIVLSNPPYVRMELLRDLKPYLKTRFDVYHGVADLYCYFFERGLRILRTGGRLGYISSSTFFKTAFGKPLRDYLRTHAAIETIVDFGDLQIFQGVTTYPAIIIMKAGDPTTGHELAFWNVDKLPKENFEAAFVDHAAPYPQSQLGSGSWMLENPELRQLRHKIVSGKKTLTQIYDSPYRGVLTGRNDVFVIDRAIRNELLAQDTNSADLIKPWIDGAAIRRWRLELSEKFLIFTRRGVQLDRYPAIKAYLAEHRERLEPKPPNWKPSYTGETWLGRKSGIYEWYEMQDTVAYYALMTKPKILFRDISASPTFSLDNSGGYNDTTSYFIPNADGFLLSLLNSNIFWFWIKGQTPMARGGYYRFKAQYIDWVPIPNADEEQKAELAAFAEQAQAAAEERYRLQQDLTRRIPDLVPEGREPKLTNRLKNWWELPDFTAFRDEIGKAFKGEIPLKERNDWEELIADTRGQIHALTAEIARIEREIDVRVYALFELTEKEIALLEANI